MKMVAKLNDATQEWSGDLVGFVSPLVLATCLCALLLTSHKLPSWRVNWFNKIASSLRYNATRTELVFASSDEGLSGALRLLPPALRYFWLTLRLPFQKMSDEAKYGHDLASRKENQFGRGEPNFNAMAIFLAFIPMIYLFSTGLPNWFSYIPIEVEEGYLDPGDVLKTKIEWASYLFGWVACVCLIFFLIPVTRHSVLLAAMGWSPIHALRIHIWFGYLCYTFLMIHGIMLVPVWFVFYDYPIYKQFIPHPKCWTWTWTDETSEDIQPGCSHVYYNLTGILAALAFTVLWGSSLNWVRRRNYRLFYILHIIFGSLGLLGTIAHMPFVSVYLLPGLVYYLASTTPAVVQAIASRFRGGVKIRKVLLVEDSGGCVEVHIDSEKIALAVLDREPCQFIKLCVPKISLVWHPFDVYKTYSVDGTPEETVRFLFRPVGPFTKALAEQLTSSVARPVTLVDGFYLGSDKIEMAMQHDTVTMVAGGIALSPYLTLIPAMLNRIALMEQDDGAGIKTKSIVLHWVCREAGLCKFYVENYLNTFLMRAKALNLGTSFTIYVYQTGATKFIPSDHDLEEKMVDTEELSKDDYEGKTSSSASPVEQPVNDDTNTQEGGHPLELARMLPRRYSNPIWNIPYFLYVSGAVFFGFWYLFNRYKREASWPYYSYSDIAKMTWFILALAPIFLVVGMLPEAFVLGLRKVWPQPVPDEYEIVRGGGQKNNGNNFDDAMVVDKELNKHNSEVTIVYREGRPTEDQIFQDARKAAEPGIFMCGPPAMTRMVKIEAGKENAYLGLTRYCLYDEPYEM